MNTHRPLGTPSWADLQSPDPEKARAFYGALFGWTFNVGGPESGHYAMANVGGRPAAGIGGMQGGNHPSVWTVYFATESVDATVGAIQSEGGQVFMPPMDVMDEGRMAVVADPTSAVFGLWQPKRFGGANAWAEPGALCWMEVNTRQSEKARDFYAKVFGLTWKAMEGMQYYTLHKGDDPNAVAGVLQMTEQWPAHIPPHWMPYFGVPDTDAAVEQVKALGGKQLVPAFDTPYGRISVVADPFGAFFKLIRMPSFGK